MTIPSADDLGPAAGAVAADGSIPAGRAAAAPGVAAAAFEADSPSCWLQPPAHPADSGSPDAFVLPLAAAACSLPCWDPSPPSFGFSPQPSPQPPSLLSPQPPSLFCWSCSPPHASPQPPDLWKKNKNRINVIEFRPGTNKQMQEAPVAVPPQNKNKYHCINILTTFLC